MTRHINSSANRCTWDECLTGTSQTRWVDIQAPRTLAMRPTGLQPFFLDLPLYKSYKSHCLNWKHPRIESCCQLAHPLVQSIRHGDSTICAIHHRIRTLSTTCFTDHPILSFLYLYLVLSFKLPSTVS